MNLRHAMLSTLAVAFVAAGAAQAQTPAAHPTHIAVVNLLKVFNSMQETKDINAKLEADSNSLKTLQDSHQADLNNMQQMIRNGPKPGTDQYDDLINQLDKKRVDYETDIQMKKIGLVRGRNRELKTILDKVESVVSDLAKQDGLDLVLTEIRPDLPPDVQDVETNQLLGLINQRNVLYASDEIDITSQVITALDAKYKSGGK